MTEHFARHGVYRNVRRGIYGNALGRGYTILYLRYNQNYRIVMLAYFPYLLYTELFPA